MQLQELLKRKFFIIEFLYLFISSLYIFLGFYFLPVGNAFDNVLYFLKDKAYFYLFFFILIFNIVSGILIGYGIFSRYAGKLQDIYENPEARKKEDFHRIIKIFYYGEFVVFTIYYLRFLLLFFLILLIKTAVSGDIQYSHNILITFLLFFSGIHLLFTHNLVKETMDFVTTETKFFSSNFETPYIPKTRFKFFLETFILFHFITGIIASTSFLFHIHFLLTREITENQKIGETFLLPENLKLVVLENLLNTALPFDEQKFIEIYRKESNTPIKDYLEASIKEELYNNVLSRDKHYTLAKANHKLYIIQEVSDENHKIVIYTKYDKVIFYANTFFRWVLYYFSFPAAILISLFIGHSIGLNITHIHGLNAMIDRLHGGSFPFPAVAQENIHSIPASHIGVSLLKIESFSQFLFEFVSDLKFFLANLKTVMDLIMKLIEETTSIFSQVQGDVENLKNDYYKQYVEDQDMIHKLKEEELTIHSYVNSIKHLQNEIDEMNRSISNLVSIYNATKNEASIGKANLKKLDANITDLVENSSKIQKIVKLIQDISKQVDLLALNASIEAARAGEQGKGFAVVAEEISKLSLKIQENLKTINEHIKENKEKTGEAIENAKITLHMFNRVIVDLATLQNTIEEIIHIKDGLEKENNNIRDIIEKLNNYFNKLQSTINTNITQKEEFLKTVIHLYEEYQNLHNLVSLLPVHVANITEIIATINQKISYFKKE